MIHQRALIWKSISFGFIAKYMTPYCTCDEALKKGQYITGALMPAIILGIIPAIVAVITGSFILFEAGYVQILRKRNPLYRSSLSGRSRGIYKMSFSSDVEHAVS